MVEIYRLEKTSVEVVTESRIINIYQGYLVQRFNIHSSAIGRFNGIKEEHILVMYNMCFSLFLRIFINLGLEKFYQGTLCMRIFYLEHILV
ncbi:hypothetical protein CN387_17485 [Bacillus cereus]|nr:hypothetical protein CN387_17485 [Bacillus cereus]PFW30368.1 hypothetical protein COL07_09445 [Bacillus cereus]